MSPYHHVYQKYSQSSQTHQYNCGKSKGREWVGSKGLTREERRKDKVSQLDVDRRYYDLGWLSKRRLCPNDKTVGGKFFIQVPSRTSMPAPKRAPRHQLRREAFQMECKCGGYSRHFSLMKFFWSIEWPLNEASNACTTNKTPSSRFQKKRKIQWKGVTIQCGLGLDDPGMEMFPRLMAWRQEPKPIEFGVAREKHGMRAEQEQAQAEADRWVFLQGISGLDGISIFVTNRANVLSPTYLAPFDDDSSLPRQTAAKTTICQTRTQWRLGNSLAISAFGHHDPSPTAERRSKVDIKLPPGLDQTLWDGKYSRWPY